MIRILLADSHPLIHAGLQAVLQPVRDLELLDEVEHAEDWPRLCRDRSVDVLLVNTNRPGFQVEPLLAAMAAVAPQTHVLLMLGPAQPLSFSLHKLLQTGGG